MTPAQSIQDAATRAAAEEINRYATDRLTNQENLTLDSDEIAAIIARHASKENDALRTALREIQKGEGPFSRDHITHAENTIEAMKGLARTALGLSQDVRGGQSVKNL